MQNLQVNLALTLDICFDILFQLYVHYMNLTWWINEFFVNIHLLDVIMLEDKKVDHYR